jgi:hypothetical protein
MRFFITFSRVDLDLPHLYQEKDSAIIHRVFSFENPLEGEVEWIQAQKIREKM